MNCYVPLLSPVSDTVLYVYFGNPLAGDQQDRAAVWDAGYYGVYHLADAAGSSLRDSTSRAASLTRRDGSSPQLDTTGGRMGGSQQFRADHADYALSSAPESQTGPSTLSLWVKRSEKYSGGQLSGYVTRSPSGTGDLEFRSAPAPNSLAVYVEGAARPIVSDVGKNWTYVTLARNGAALKAYVNGQLAQTLSIAPARRDHLERAVFLDFARYWGFRPRLCRHTGPRPRARSNRA